MKNTRGRKSRETIPLNACHANPSWCSTFQKCTFYNYKSCNVLPRSWIYSYILVTRCQNLVIHSQFYVLYSQVHTMHSQAEIESLQLWFRPQLRGWWAVWPVGAASISIISGVRGGGNLTNSVTASRKEKPKTGGHRPPPPPIPNPIHSG